MNTIEKRDYIQSHLHIADDSVINEFYEMLRKEEALKEKLTQRAKKSEQDILSGKVFTRSEIEQRTNNIGR
ncbi:MAG: hypothetical protein JW801_10420 [Bacteroidales bacterium]|nr:hypothetical protein [Bacteroidales bacterium]